VACRRLFSTRSVGENASYKLQRFNRAPPLPADESAAGEGPGVSFGAGLSAHRPIFDRGFPSPTEPSLTMAESVITTNGRGSIVTVPLPSWRTTWTVPMP
jgi:hypothetical protein